MRRMMTRLGWGTKAHSPSALHSVPSFFSCDRLAKQRNVRIFFMHNKSQCCCAVTTGTLLIICKSHVFHYKQATSASMAMRLCADVHGNNWNIQPVLMILWGDIFVLWRTCFKFQMNTCTCTRVFWRLSSCYWSPALPRRTTRGTISIQHVNYKHRWTGSTKSMPLVMNSEWLWQSCTFQRI